MQDYEKLGVFYLGKEYDLAAGKPNEQLLLYESKDLTTHAVCVGMTGSGKTGLCLSLMEEAAIDGIPVIAIDPKGDLGNLMLTFPELKPSDFQPWIDPADAARKGVTPEQYATQSAENWKKGLADWGQPQERIAKFRDAVDIAIYTPGSSAGLPLTVLRSFAAPPAELVQSGEAYRERIASAVSGLLGLLGVEADPINSREHILLSNIFDHAWRAGTDLDMAGLIRSIQQPAFDKVGFIDLETFYPAKERFALAMSLNNLLASPNFAAWMEGDALDVAALLHTPTGKPRISILSIAHLSDSERMFFVTILLNEVLTWVRAQSGTSSLRAILYMDEVFGYFPPSANPPSKTPMLTLLKQARAFGLGIVLATQNPVDLDYKGLSNAGTWFLGRLQTERDKMRVLDGLEGASAQAGAKFDRQSMTAILSQLDSRVFLMNNVHDDAPVVFQTRFALSFLRGPLTRDQISTLMGPRKAGRPAASAAARPMANATIAGAAGASTARPVMPPDVPELFLPQRGTQPSGATLVYRPALLGQAKVHYAEAKSGIDQWENVSLVNLVAESAAGEVWGEAQSLEADVTELENGPDAKGKFAALAPELSRAKSYADWSADLKAFLYRTQSLSVFKCADLKETSKPGEAERDFRVRISQTAREARDADLEKLKAKYAPKLAAVQEQVRKAQARVEKEKTQATQSTFNAALTFGASVFGAIMSRKVTSAANISKAATAMRAGGRAMEQRADIGAATDTVEALQQKFADLDGQFKAEAEKLEAASSPDALTVEAVNVKPKKTEISVDRTVLLWTPWWQAADGSFSEAF